MVEAPSCTSGTYSLPSATMTANSPPPLRPIVSIMWVSDSLKGVSEISIFHDTFPVPLFFFFF